MDEPTTGEIDFFLDESELSDRRGRIELEVVEGEVVMTRFPEDAGRDSHVVIRYDVSTRLLTIFPMSYRDGALEPQFRHIEQIQIEASDWNPSSHSQQDARYDLLSARGLPRGFHTIYDFGLGIAKGYRSFVDSIEDYSDHPVLRFINDGEEGPDDSASTMRVKLSRFVDYRVAVDRYRERGWTVVRRIIDAETHNAIAPLFHLRETTAVRGRHPMVQVLTEEVETGHVIDAADRELLADAVTKAAPAIGTESPARLMQLREDIELVTMDALIAQFEVDLADGHSRDEAHWQQFFGLNRFALQLLFAVPVVVEWEQAHVRPPDVTGRGARIADFLCANVVTRTVLLVEIKTPASSLMATNPYRGRGSEAAVHAPHRDLVGAVAQVHSQMSSIPRSFPQLAPSDSTINPWAPPRGAVITGRLSGLTDEQRESFLRYRDGLSSVTLLAYDEVLERLKALRAMLASPPDPEGNSTRS